MSEMSLLEIPSSPLLEAVDTLRPKLPSSPLLPSAATTEPGAAQPHISEDVTALRKNAPVTDTEIPLSAATPTNTLARPLPTATISTTAPAIEKPHHPFANHIFHLGPCIRHMPYLTENLLPLLFSSALCDHLFTTPSSHLSALSAQDRIVDSLSLWLRDVNPTPASAATRVQGVDVDVNRTVPESQSFPSLQKAVLVEPRRRQQTREMVDKLCTELTLAPSISPSNHTHDIAIAVDDALALEIGMGVVPAGLQTSQPGKTVQIWDWRVAEDVVQLLLTHRSRLHHLPTALAGAADDATRADIEAQIHLDANAELEMVLKKGYLGCVAWSGTLGRNVFCDAALGRALGSGAGLNLQAI